MRAPGARLLNANRSAVQGSEALGASAFEERARQRDASLVRRCREGDKAAWVAIVERFSAYVYAIANRFGLPEDGVEDVFQEVFMRVFTRLDSLRDDAALKPWIAQLTRRAAIDRLRSEVREVSALDADRLASEEPALEQIEEAMTVYRAVDELPSPYRDAIRLFFLEDWSYRAISETLGISGGTVASRISRGLGMLREVLAEDVPAGMSA
jgi:RNA polymerase sigma-70 factor (ECF subfamily)